MQLEDLIAIRDKKKKYIIGLMSGTSLDGVDAALIELKGSGTKTEIKLQGFVTYPFPGGFKEKLLENSTTNSGNVTDICRLNFLLAHLYADAVKYLLKKAKVPIKKIDLIGSHGQTIHHLPNKENYLGYRFGSTLQIGDPSVIAKLTGITTVGDFRTGDVALNGEGAPLVPYFDYIMFNSSKKNRALLNIGGISNITFLKKNSTFEDVIAFDTGPGNIMIDLLSKKLFKVEYDKDGKLAKGGKINDELLKIIIKNDNFIFRTPPKSTGREYYDMSFINKVLQNLFHLPPNDIIATFTEFTAYSIFNNYAFFFKDKILLDELFVSGGGAYNQFLLRRLEHYFGYKVSIKTTEKLNIGVDLKEAVCFAVFANETLHGNPVNIPNVTGAGRPTILGKICLP